MRERYFKWNRLIKYDHKKAYAAGQRGTPLDEVKELGYDILNYEIPKNLGCTLFEVRNKVKNHPSYIEELYPFWDFKKKS